MNSCPHAPLWTNFRARAKIKGMKEHKTIAGKIYTVTSPNGCTVTDETGLQLGTVEAGEQKAFTATGGAMWLDDTAARVTENFKQAPVKMRLLGLLGGGVSTGLPSRYLQAEFIEFTGNTVIRISVPVNNDLGLYFDYEKTLPIATNDFPISWQRSNPYRAFRLVCDETFGGFNWWGTNLACKTPAGYRALWQANFKNNRTISVNSAEYGYAEKSLPDIDCNYDEVAFGRLFLLDSKLFCERTYFKSYSIKLSSESKVVNDLIPAIAPTGEPCMYDKVTRKPFCNSGTGSFIVGMDMKQARQLGKLPTGGGSLTVSLPSNYQEDEGVVNALAMAQENGWKITIQTYEAESGAASTFALRRVWVRKTQDEQGSYVDSDGFRWQVEWCVDVVGSSPEAEGYEPFRSVDVAVNYWGLTAWVDPEAEEELLTNTDEV